METTIMGYIGTTMKSITSFIANQGPAQTNLNTEPGGGPAEVVTRRYLEVHGLL